MTRQVFKFFRGSPDLCKKEKKFLTVNANSPPTSLFVFAYSIFATITNHIRSIIGYSMTIVDWLAAGGIEFATFSTQWEARACCPDQ
jgi:hypothetical protein